MRSRNWSRRAVEGVEGREDSGVSGEGRRRLVVGVSAGVRGNGIDDCGAALVGVLKIGFGFLGVEGVSLRGGRSACGISGIAVGDGDDDLSFALFLDSRDARR